MTYACPKCGSPDCLWRGVDVPGWESVGGDLKPQGDHEALWPEAQSDGTYGCGDCSWEGFRDDLVRLGIDGNPLPEVDPGQLAIE